MSEENKQPEKPAEQQAEKKSALEIKNAIKPRLITAAEGDKKKEDGKRG